MDKENVQKMIFLALKSVSLGMGVAVLVLSFFKQIDYYSGLSMLGIGLTCIGITLLQEDK